MKALVCADTRPQERLSDMYARTQPDLLITLGDLQYHDIVDVETIPVPKSGVYGNHCRFDYMEELGIWNMHLKIWDFGGLRFGGFEGSVRYKPVGEHQYHQDEALLMLAGFPPVDVLITHSPPYQINDHEDPAHIGFMALKNYLYQHRPRHLFHGHTYPEPPITQWESTQIHYVHGAEVIEFQ